MKKAIITILLFSAMLNATEDLFVQGCKDVLAKRYTLHYDTTAGYIIGVKDMYLEEFNRYNMSSFQGVDAPVVCKRFLQVATSSLGDGFKVKRYLLMYSVRDVLLQNNGETLETYNRHYNKVKKLFK